MNIKRIQNLLNKLGPYANKIFIPGQWTITETIDGYVFKRIDEKKEKKKDNEENK